MSILTGREERLLAVIEEVHDRLEDVWSRMEPDLWTSDPRMRVAGGQVESVVQGVYFAIERLRSAYDDPQP